ncbi:hypothetical protein BTZ20_4612 [Rhodococcus sp. MTM3W5.2]|nr:hypothetical protein BTZ20_4612 [Rhodococcus sp. MTM3W5.2]
MCRLRRACATVRRPEPPEGAGAGVQSGPVGLGHARPSAVGTRNLVWKRSRGASEFDPVTLNPRPAWRPKSTLPVRKHAVFRRHCHVASAGAGGSTNVVAVQSDSIRPWRGPNGESVLPTGNKIHTGE